MRQFLFCTLVLFLNVSFSQQVIPLWDQVPNYQPSGEEETVASTNIDRISLVQDPTIEVYLPTKRSATGQAVLICPGGGYAILAYDWEGTEVAKWLNSQGIAGIVLKYRLPNSKSVITPHKAPLQDAQRAMRLIRANADQWNIDPGEVGVMGFSAGGHLASTLSTHYDEKVYDPSDATDDQAAKPDFSVLIYPVISFGDEVTHSGSRRNLIGENPDEAMVEHFSNHLQVDKDTPPAFLLHASDDGAVAVENSILYYQALIRNKVSAEMHIYPKGGHGFGLAIGQGHLSTWPDRLADWLSAQEEGK